MTTVEYGLILALVALALPGVIYVTNTAIKSRFETTVADNGGCIEENCPEYTGDNPQRIAWDRKPTDGQVGERINLSADFPAYAFSALPVEFVSDTLDKCTIVYFGDATPPRYELWYNHTDTCTVSATQPGDITWAPADRIPAVVSPVRRGNQDIVFDTLSTPAAVSSTAPLRAVSMVRDRTWESGQVVQFTATGACTIDSAQTTVTYSDLPGTCTITASEPGNVDWNAADPEVQSVTVVGMPEAQTEDATSVQATSATLNGTVTANNNVGVSIEFRYCTVPTVDAQSDELTDNSCVDVSGTGAPAGTSPVPVAASATGLSASTTYYFQVVWTYGTSSKLFSSYGSFSTLAAPVQPTAITAAASGIGRYTATLNGRVNPNGGSTTVTFRYCYGNGRDDVDSNGMLDDNSCAVATASESPVGGPNLQSVTATLTGLTKNREYYFQVVAARSGSATVYGTPLRFTTSNASNPSVDTRDESGVGRTTATLNGRVDANSVSTDVTFEICTNSGMSANCRTVTASPANVSSSNEVSVNAGVTGLTRDTRYYFRVIATSLGDTFLGDVVDFRTNN